MDISVPIPPPLSRTEHVLKTIKHAILSGQLSSGSQLVETDLAARFGVSKTPVREALKTLAGSGLVEMSQYKGATVRTVDAAMARSVYDVRVLLEPEALHRSLALGTSLSAAGEALDRAEGATDRAERSLTNRDFHRSLYAGCGNPLLVRILDDLRDQTALVSAAVWETVPSWERESEEHREILAAALAGDADGASARLRAHITSFVEHAFPTQS
jgi:DNA-binding GntR family transcriptional regulator